DISTAQADISTAQADISTAQADISTAQADITGAQADISGAQVDISGVQNTVSGLQTSVVYVTGNQLIQGTKTFDGDVYATGAFLYNNMPPTGTSSYGKSGQMAFDSSYLYVCTGNNSWGRIEFTDSIW
ncbi:MAG: hypothetical protein EBY39_06100, partial [Flavobacteriia bacterium]|nr:hypothetical protein [Flavobacteriia bacterium]